MPPTTTPGFKDIVEQFKYTGTVIVKPESATHLPPTPVRKRKYSSSDHGATCNTSSTSTPPKKKPKPARSYASPDVYSHLNFLPDHLSQNLDIIFCGINPGKKSAQVGHHFGNPTNHFWFCLHAAGFTPTLLKPDQDFTLPVQYSLGMTNLVDRPTTEQSELSESEQISSIPTLLRKIHHHRPKIVCFVGLGIAKIVFKGIVIKTTTTTTSNNNDASNKPSASAPKSYMGLQSYKLVYPEDQTETLFYAVPSTSGRVVQFQRSDKTKMFIQLHQLLDKVKQGGDMETKGLHIINASEVEFQMEGG